MRYYLIAGETSGDLHATHLMDELRAQDPEAAFRYFYRPDLAYMGFIPVLLHLRTILRGMKECQRDILSWKPDVLILVDYPGFNLKVARYIKLHSHIPIFYYISPKIWAWKEGRIHRIRRDVDELFSILPFEVEYFERKHHFPIHYIGNPSVDEVAAFQATHPADARAFRMENGLDERPIIALLAGSRRQEIRDNLRRMAEAVLPYASAYQMVLAAAPGIDDAFYEQYAPKSVTILRSQTYRILQHSTAALVTSGTATLEAALFRVPQVVCYYMRAGRLASLGKRLLLKVPYISLVNLVADREVVPELVADQMNATNVRRHLAAILPGGPQRAEQLAGYQLMADRLGQPGAPRRAAQQIIALLKQRLAASKEETL